jgi:hypothetical protein
MCRCSAASVQRENVKRLKWLWWVGVMMTANDKPECNDLETNLGIYG